MNGLGAPSLFFEKNDTIKFPHFSNRRLSTSLESTSRIVTAAVDGASVVSKRMKKTSSLNCSLNVNLE